MSSLFSLFKKKVFEAMVVSPGRSSSLQSIKGVSQLCPKLKPFKKKALILFLKLETWSCEERWNLLCCGFKKEVMNTKRRCWVTIQLSYPPDSWPITKVAQGTSSGSLVVHKMCSLSITNPSRRGRRLYPLGMVAVVYVWIHKASGHHLSLEETGDQKALEIKGRVDQWLSLSCKGKAALTMYLAIFVKKVHGSFNGTNQEPALALTSLNQPITCQHSLLQSDQFTQIANKKTPS
ncbi:hypothetical protein IGI04_040403 [Brassica rapa subsp. trilocularis]|uniref:Uncharacterized protein n=1 Tax=Brassica rapa subsp. trilocularis TaxID=1813537 RepID=A0ABQ7KPE0_BRACM|nr:hypothetical protein IGI04_042530 [Brassica rapa subsp. trilocularis]KAG5375807.1 hypothetical protein IGI04_040403 [Brassica rapa subsp. trilocularis]